MMHNKYWSCSSFADWLRGANKPDAETGEGWSNWKKQAKTVHPFRYWLAEEALDRIQDVVYWPFNKLYSVKYWLANRFVTHTHTLTSNLKRGAWHELDTRMLHSMFDELVNFVEVEQAWMQIAFDKEARKRYNSPRWSVGWFRTRTWRCPQAGLDYLDWASKLIIDESWGIEKDHPDYGKSTYQAKAAKEIIELYNWWKHERPLRPDPMDASGWSALCEERRSKTDPDDEWIFNANRSDEQRKATEKALNLCNKLEVKYDKEDEKMMIRLIKVRKSLWT